MATIPQFPHITMKSDRDDVIYDNNHNEIGTIYHPRKQSRNGGYMRVYKKNLDVLRNLSNAGKLFFPHFLWFIESTIKQDIITISPVEIRAIAKDYHLAPKTIYAAIREYIKVGMMIPVSGQGILKNSYKLNMSILGEGTYDQVSFP